MLEKIANLIVFLIGRTLYFFPRKIHMLFGRLIGDAAFFLIVKRRRLGLFNVRVVLGDSIGYSEARRIVKNTYRNLGKMAIEFLLMPFYTKDDIGKLIHGVEGIKLFDEILSEGKGVILHTAHFGDWEMLGAYLGLSGYPLYAFNRKQKGIFGKIVDKHRKKVGMRLTYKNSALAGARKALREGGILGILADQGGIIMGELFDHMTLLPQGAAAFALKFDVPVLPCFLVRKEDDTYQLYIGPVIRLPYKKKHTRVYRQGKVQELLKVVEDMIVMFPDQWFWLQRFWIGCSPGTNFQKHVKIV